MGKRFLLIAAVYNYLGHAVTSELQRPSNVRKLFQLFDALDRRTRLFLTPRPFLHLTQAGSQVQIGGSGLSEEFGFQRRHSRGHSTTPGRRCNKTGRRGSTRTCASRSMHGTTLLGRRPRICSWRRCHHIVPCKGLTFFKMVAAVSKIARHFLWCLVSLERLGSNLFLEFPVTVIAYTQPKIGLISFRCIILLVQFVEMIEASHAVLSSIWAARCPTLFLCR